MIKSIDAEIYFKLNADAYHVSLDPILDLRIRSSDEIIHEIHAKFVDGILVISREDAPQYDPRFAQELYDKLNTQANIDRILRVIKTMAAKVETTCNYTCIGLDCNEE